MTIQVRVKRWGNSFGIVLPKEFVERERLKENEKISINLIKEVDLSDIFGSLKGKIKMTAQQFKDEIRQEEAEAEERKWKQHIS